ncbi:hypothetical protein C5167_046138 [Papaver somniferum]|uniref:Uncharacterized protein n=1 Tax=Papaver somniferum TaxID=3469 RepID=A0A4Y7LF83_PAPSO|nr:hypothetical protein C5167_046138 [Papaver somniferum]
MLIVRRKKKVVGTQFREHERGAGITLKYRLRRTEWWINSRAVQVVITIRFDNFCRSLRIIKQLRHLALAGTLIERGKKHQSKTDGELHFK